MLYYKVAYSNYTLVERPFNVSFLENNWHSLFISDAFRSALYTVNGLAEYPITFWEAVWVRFLISFPGFAVDNCRVLVNFSVDFTEL